MHTFAHLSIPNLKSTVFHQVSCTFFIIGFALQLIKYCSLRSSTTISAVSGSPTTSAIQSPTVSTPYFSTNSKRRTAISTLTSAAWLRRLYTWRCQVNCHIFQCIKDPINLKAKRCLLDYGKYQFSRLWETPIFKANFLVKWFSDSRKKYEWLNQFGCKQKLNKLSEERRLKNWWKQSVYK